MLDFISQYFKIIPKSSYNKLLEGISITNAIYSQNVIGKKRKNTILNAVTLNPKYSDIPPHTPDITLFELDLYNIFAIKPLLSNELNITVARHNLRLFLKF